MTGKPKSYRDLIVWQKAMDLVVAVYAVSARFPASERFGLTAQVRRAVVSVPSNIAEGQARDSTKEFLHHLSISKGSLAETETQLMVSIMLGFVVETDMQESWGLCREVGKLLNGLVASLVKLTTGHLRLAWR